MAIILELAELPFKVRNIYAHKPGEIRLSERIKDTCTAPVSEPVASLVFPALSSHGPCSIYLNHCEPV